METTRAGVVARSERSARRRIRGSFGDRHFVAIGIGPSMFAFAVMLLFPLVYSLYISFYSWRLTNPDVRTFVGLENYVKLFISPTASRFSIWVPLINTAIYTFSTVFMEFVLGFGIALLFQRQGKKLPFLRTFVTIPMMISEVVIALMWRLMWSANAGMVNFLIGLVGLPAQAWLGNRNLALLTVAMTDVWHNTPFVFLMLLAGLQALPEEIYESAVIDGANAFQRFRHITVPLLMPVIVIALLFRFIFNFRDFAKIYALTGGGPGRSTEVLSLMLYQHMFRNFDAGFASALAWVIVLMSVVIVLMFLRPLQRHMGER